MIYLWILLVLHQLIIAENRIVPDEYEPITPMRVRDDLKAQTTPKRNLLPIDDDSGEENEVVEENEQKIENNHTPCTVVVVSNIQAPNMHTLMRKYRYDKNGVLIPSSVKYYMKRLEANSPSYVALSDQAFSPQGGFIRYFKEVPPIPRIW
ncbi:uncharacterized protein LOC121734502 [Aricia agestis]|uniref:uncharacterized protein LOC121734502 n=1 Tax=Aricia agestis TaxID=91739 RepID=UPI001C205587|nr:uncharacterized protein LOC121734502 [Aricia agestis]